MDATLISGEYENQELKRRLTRLLLEFSLGELPVPLEFSLFRYGYDIRRSDISYTHPAPAFERLFLFYRRGGVIRIGGEEHEFQPGRFYLLPGHLPFEVTYFERSELLYAHWSAADFTHRPLLRSRTGLFSFDASGWRELLPKLWRRGEHPAVASAAVAALWPVLQGELEGMKSEYLLFQRFRPVFDYVREQPPALLRVGEMAERMGITQAAFSRLFSQVFGTPPKSYLEEIYLARARELLLFTPLSVDAVARELGHEHPHYFHTRFPRLTGATPGEFRVKNREIS